MNYFLYKIGIENPSTKKMYEQVIKNIEKFTQTIDFMFINLTLPGVMIPRLIISYLNYFSTNLGREGFKLPFPEW